MFKRTMITVMIFAVAILGAGNWSSSARVAAMAVDELNEADDLDEVQDYSPRTGNSTDVEQREELREEFHQTYPLAANGRVSLENLNGAARITVWDRNEVQVNAVKRAYRQDRLNEAKVEVSSTPDAIRIETTYPRHNMNFTNEEKGRYYNPATVEYSITVPRQARLESIEMVNGSLDIDGVEGDVNASTVNGAMTVRGLKGEAKLNTVNGELEAVFAQLEPTKTLSLGSVNGSVVMIIPSDSNAVVRAETLSGSISNDFGLDTQDGEYVGHSLYGQIGSGGPRIKLGNVNGGINVKHAQDGRRVSGSTTLLPQKDKDKEKYKNKGILSEEEQKKIQEDARGIADEVRKEIDSEKIQRDIQLQVQRSLHDSQREIERAQREVQRETQRQVREEMRREGRGTGRGRGEGSGRRVTEQESKTFPVASIAHVNLVTYDGSITVHGWDKAEVKYTATKSGHDEQEVKAIHIEAEQQGSEISIIAKSEEDQGSTSLEAFVPRNATVHVSSGDGSLSLQGVSGELTLRTGDGSVEVSDSKGQLQANTGDGSIQVSNFDGQADARTGDGSISLDGRFTSLNARTGDGSISLSVPPDSNFTVETNTEEISNEGLTISEDIAPSKRAKRWKVGRGGNIFVLGTGDGKIVLRPR
ncbi:MAG: DUF4097 family beta strand repeat-containing protein [Acidobacteriota bacterium]|nr:DUF4097 family beta strand repeat-containing protein [Acidobacteriota bacterium]